MYSVNSIYGNYNQFDTIGIGAHETPTPSTQLELMQFTGFKDKNGREVYEGDYVSVENPDPKNFNPYFPALFEIGFSNKQASFTAKRIKPYLDKRKDIQRMRSYTWSFFQKKHSVEVLGNIYENPELLK